MAVGRLTFVSTKLEPLHTLAIFIYVPQLREFPTTVSVIGVAMQ